MGLVAAFSLILLSIHCCEAAGCPCLNGGKCIGRTTKCRCPKTFTGEICQKSVCNCKNGGTCLRDGSCKCPAPFIGKDCQMECPCMNGGRCVGDPVRCQCPSQVFGDICELRCPCKNEGRCTSVRVKDEKTCQRLGLGFKNCSNYKVECRCKTEWTGSLCLTSACQCQNGGTCVGRRCVCPAGFVGKNCEIKIKCCSVFGDPHVMSFDGARMDFQGDCRYNLMSICPCVVAPNGAPSFSIHMKNWRKGVPKRKVSWLRSLDVYIDGTMISLEQKRKVFINGVKATLPIKRIKKSVISSDGTHVRIDTDFGASVSFNGKTKATVCVPESWMGKLCGICGNFDGIRENDYVTRDGDKLEHIKYYKQRAPHVARSWRVMDKHGETCAEAPLFPDPEPESETWNQLVQSREYCGLMHDKKGPFEKGIQKMSPSKVVEYFKACVFDVIEASPDKKEAKQMACSSLEAFASECAEMNTHVDISWRNITGCVFKCPNAMTYKEKMSQCVGTCADPKAEEKCTLAETEGCACAGGLLLSGGQCVKASKCGCTDKDGSYYKPREEFFSEDCKKKFVCQPGNAKNSSRLVVLPGCSSDQTCVTIDGVQKCVLTPVSGDWSDWTEWSACTRLAGHEGMVQLRTRACDNPPPKNGGTCYGESTEIQECLPGDYETEITSVH